MALMRQSTTRRGTHDTRFWCGNKTFKESNLRMLENKVLCDVTFLAGNNKNPVHAHKFMLVSRSPVFYTMFCGNVPETGKEVAIPDLEEDVLSEMLRFLYTDTCKVSNDSVMSLLYASKKYQIPGLHKLCEQFLKVNLCRETVCTILQQAHSFDEPGLFQLCLNYVLMIADVIFDSEDIYCLEKEVLGKIISEDRLKVDETKIYKTCISWAENKCESLGRNKTTKNIRDTLGNLIYLIRFPQMDIQSFTDIVSEEDVLTASEKVNVYQHIVNANKCKAPSVFQTKPRTKKHSVLIQRFDFLNSLNQIWQHSGKYDAINFVCSEDVILTGVSVFLPCERGVLEGDLELMKDEEKLLSMKLVLEFKKDHFVEAVMFETPVYIKKDTTYTLMQALRGAQTFRGQFGQECVEEQGVKVWFSNNERSINGTKVSHGQIYGIHLEY